MTEINLLPWKEELIKTQNKIFAIIIGIVAICCTGLCLLITSYISSKITFESKEIQLLTQEIDLLENKIQTIKELQTEQNLLLEKREIIQSLQTSRSFVVQLFNDIVTAIPDGLYLHTMSRKDNKLTLQGMSSSNSRISIFMRNLAQLPWFTNAALQEIKTTTTNSNQNNNLAYKEIMFSLQGEINN